MFAFLPAVFIIYRLLPGIRSRNVFLALSSLVFYAFGQLVYLPLFLASILINYISGLLLSGKFRRSRLILTLAVVLNLGILCVFKYTDFLIGNVNSLFGTAIPLTGIVLPIGISFFTFQGLSYTIDVYREPECGTRDFTKLLLYISFFPQLIAGPIVKYHDVAAQIDSRRCTRDETEAGIRRFIVGLAKKVLISNAAGYVVDKVFSDCLYAAGGLDWRLAWLAGICYTLQIYFDFSGYSDMAIGLGKMLGFDFKENFNYPYISKSASEFWHRWHISLGSFFRDYVYIPLGGNRVSRGKWVRNILVVWGLTGLWHGADWNFLLWGLYYGVLLLIEKLWLGKYLERLPKALRWLLCMIIVCIGWVMFNLTDFAQMRCALARMFRFTHVALSQSLAADVSIVPPLLWMIPALVFATPVCRRVHLGESYGAEIVRNVVCLALLAVCIVFSVSATFNPFIYFRF